MKHSSLVTALVGAAALIAAGVTDASACSKGGRAPAKRDACRLIEPAAAPAPATTKTIVVRKAADPAEAQASRDGCPLVHNAVLRQIYKDGQRRYSWQNSDWWYMKKPKSELSRLCDHAGKLAWWDPPADPELDKDAAEVKEWQQPRGVVDDE
jgi:hypothetical protein